MTIIKENDWNSILSWKSILKQNLLMNDMVCAINGAVASGVVRECKNIVWIRVVLCRS